MVVGIRGLGLIGGSFEKAFLRAGHNVLNLKNATPDRIRSCSLVIVCLPPLMVAPYPVPCRSMVTSALPVCR
jgi:prephenate dehydrogenase